MFKHKFFETIQDVMEACKYKCCRTYKENVSRRRDSLGQSVLHQVQSFEHCPILLYLQLVHPSSRHVPSQRNQVLPIIILSEFSW